jgi:DNA processing protein
VAQSDQIPGDCISMTTITAPTEAQLANLATLDQVQARVAWSLIVEPGDKMVNAFIAAHDGDASAAFADVVAGKLSRQPDGTVAEISDALGRWMPRTDTRTLAQTIDKTIALGITVLIPGDPEWPSEKLDRLGDAAPVVLYVLGDSTLLNGSAKTIAVTGSRANSGYGEHVTIELVTGLVVRDATIITGAAYGTDAAASRAAIAAGGRTVAILAGGLDRYYPTGNTDLIERIAKNGAVVSELPVNMMTTKWRFLQRNRLIAAMSDAVIVVEAGARSGALGTARHAAAIGVPVGAVPGPVTSATSFGTNRLLRDGEAHVVTDSDEALELTVKDQF